MSGRLTVMAEDLSDLRNLGYKAGGFYLTAFPEEYGGAALHYEAMEPPWTAVFQDAGRRARPHPDPFAPTIGANWLP